MKIYTTILTLTAALLVMGCGQPTSVIEIKSRKNGGLFEFSDNGMKYKFYNDSMTYKLNTLTSISFSDFDRIQFENSPQGGYVLNFKLNESGTLKFKEMTERNLQKQVCFVVDDKIMAAPVIQAVITKGFVSLTINEKKNIDDIVKYLEN